MRRKTRLGIVGAMALAGCQGRIVVEPLSGAQVQTGYNGMAFYQSAIYEQTTIKTIYVDRGKIIAAADGSAHFTCKPVVTVQRVVAADPDRLMLIRYEPGLFETYKLGVELSDGIIKSVNIESTPDQGKTLGNLAGAAKDAATIAGSSGPASRTGGPQYLCNDGAVQTYDKLPRAVAHPPS